MNKKIAASVVGTLSLAAAAVGIDDYGDRRLGNAEMAIHQSVERVMNYNHGEYLIKVRNHRVKKDVLWVDLDVYKNEKKLDLDTPYGYTGVNILNFDKKDEAFRDMIYGTIVQQDKSLKSNNKEDDDEISGI